MQERVSRRVASLSNGSDRSHMKRILDSILTDLTEIRAESLLAIADITNLITRESNYLMTSAGLAIAGGSKLTATCANGFVYIAGGTLKYKAAGDCSALVGTIALSKSACWAFYIDSAGTITTSAKTADVDTVALAMADILAVPVPADKALIGILNVINTAGGNFVGGTTALDAATATDLYFSFVGPGAAPTAITATAPAALNTLA
jgi:hypothetical protein